ncbi:hypothetical protein [Hespellia stercorisuis]|uniref:Uncharacterized protein n=1 Tax=Hespellia stercorisuis DSM 15480 TaxID=1121950 RepID=A0A1M6RQC3_9FIRM|nr:hypothetical protein [Hespellia stercorisuis]SHK34692.1 hypothetical protein SAMN02745243_02760 [Hespellia stercorisuis DSM 15480]
MNEIDGKVQGAYNGFWKLYKNFLENHNMAAYNNGLQRLCEEFPTIFCQNLAYAWVPVINQEMDKYEKEQKEKNKPGR